MKHVYPMRPSWRERWRRRLSALRWRVLTSRLCNDEWVEHTLVPAALAFCLGFALAQLLGDDEAAQQREAAARARGELSVWRNACAALLSAPPETAPMVYGAEPVQARAPQRGVPAARYQQQAGAAR